MMKIIKKMESIRKNKRLARLKESWAFLLMGALLMVGLYVMEPQLLKVLKAAERKTPIYSVETERKAISITFDAAWDATETDLILEILDHYDAKTTFFICGYFIDRYPEAVQKIYDEGHELASHGDKHLHMSDLDLEAAQGEIEAVGIKIKNLLDIEIDLFRPPYGEYTNTVLEAAEKSGYYTVQWSIDSLDWQSNGVDATVRQVLDHKDLGNGAILLFHSDGKDTPRALASVLHTLKAEGYEFVQVSELIYRGDFSIDHTGKQKKIDAGS